MMNTTKEGCLPNSSTGHLPSIDDENALYTQHVQGETTVDNDVDDAELNSDKSDEEMEDEYLEAWEETLVKALGLDEGPNLESEEDLMKSLDELDEDEWKALYSYYTLDQKAPSSGCGVTSYDDGPNGRTEDADIMAPPAIPNGGGAISPEAPCPDDKPDDHETVQDCADAYYSWDLQYCRDCCFTDWMACGIREDYHTRWFDDDLPSFTIDDEEYQDCLEKEIVDISSKEAGCMVGSTGGVAVATVAAAVAGWLAPDVTISKATAGSASAAALTYYTIFVVGGCAGGSFLPNWSDGINAVFCSVNALTWE